MQVKHALVVTAGGADYLSTAGLANRYNVNRRTIDRWRKNPALAFPAPDLVILKREYRKLETIERWERKRATAT
jgi:hypothetical protein